MNIITHSFLSHVCAGLRLPPIPLQKGPVLKIEDVNGLMQAQYIHIYPARLRNRSTIYSTPRLRPSFRNKDEKNETRYWVPDNPRHAHLKGHAVTVAAEILSILRYSGVYTGPKRKAKQPSVSAVHVPLAIFFR